MWILVFSYDIGTTMWLEEGSKGGAWPPFPQGKEKRTLRQLTLLKAGCPHDSIPYSSVP